MVTHTKLKDIKKLAKEEKQRIKKESWFFGMKLERLIVSISERSRGEWI